MCTVTVIPTPAGPRLVHSRDELRSRSPALPPAWRDLPGRRRAVWPTDPDAGGTWIAARDDGLVLAILNRNIPPNGRPAPSRSRGGLIPALIDAGHAARAMEALAKHDLAAMAPFRLLAVDPDGVARLATWDGLSLDHAELSRPPFCLASSGLGDERVEPRYPLFEQLVVPRPTPEAQDAYHRHRWDESPEISVLMSRPDARTVSITTLGPGGDMVVEPLPEADPWCDPVGAAG
ncbi:MAG: NRDE family protein [Phycisphaerales bacterium]|nr:NRDE family protein [Planctomycetota bacterium]MCH8509153.1 NRDE family protein [Phycisphaerales bacterium]